MAELPQPEHTTLAAIERAVVASADDGLRPHLGASIIGGPCDRQLWYGFRWAAVRQHPARVLRLFARGQREEAVFVDLLRAAGVTVHEVDPQTGKQFRMAALGGHFGGSMDGAGVGFAEAPEKWHVVEFKTHGEKSFRDLQKKGVEESKPEHFAQMQIYMLLSGMDRAFYLAVNKNDDTLHAERIRFSQTKADTLLDRAKNIIASDRPPARLSEDPAWYQCKFCDYQPICHQTETPIPTCRSCVHATPKMDGNARWVCDRHSRDLTLQEQECGCPDHLYIPDLLANWARVDDAGEDCVMYENRISGETFENGPRGYSSLEIYRAEPGSIGDPVIDELKTTMGAEVVG